MSDARRTHSAAERQTKRASFLASVVAAIEQSQPQLSIVATEPTIIVDGNYVLQGPGGPFDLYEVRLIIDYRYPTYAPKVFETGGRIPKDAGRHINPDGDCCVTVWEEWLAKTQNTTFSQFLWGPLHEFFLGQWWFEIKGEWPFGQRDHGARGLLQAYGDVLNVRPRQEIVLYYLRLLSQDWPKGHWLCPCGSGVNLRKCHRQELCELHERVPSVLARRMLRQLRLNLGLAVRHRKVRA